MKKIWILIYVCRGLIQGPEMFSTIKAAEKKRSKLQVAILITMKLKNLLKEKQFDDV